jgi:hypothetical protein
MVEGGAGMQRDPEARLPTVFEPQYGKPKWRKSVREKRADVEARQAVHTNPIDVKLRAEGEAERRGSNAKQRVESLNSTGRFSDVSFH